MEKQTVNKAKKRLQGKVIGSNSKETIKVRIEQKFQHPVYKKIIRKHKSYLVHCTDTSVAIGDKVYIEEGKPVSKLKKFYFISKIS